MTQCLEFDDIGSSQLGAITFFASRHGEQCGANGLPLTPNSVKILGRFPSLKQLRHENCCRYVDIQRGNHERLVVVSEYFTKKLSSLFKAVEQQSLNEERMLHVAYQIIKGLKFLHEQQIVHRMLSSDNILLTSENLVKLFDYGLYYLSEFGRAVDFPIGYPTYLSPEILIGESADEATKSSPSCDIWSLGIVLFEMMQKKTLLADLAVSEVIGKVFSFCKTTKGDILDQLVEETGVRLEGYSEAWIGLVRRCLTVLPSKRPDAEELLNLTIFDAIRMEEAKFPHYLDLFSGIVRCSQLELPQMESRTEGSRDYLSERSIIEVYYLWQLAGGDLFALLTKAGLVRKRAPILTLPRFVIAEGEVFGLKRDPSTLFRDSVVILPQDELRERLRFIDPCLYFPLTHTEPAENKENGSKSSASSFSTKDLPLLIREKDIEYQMQRIFLFSSLLRGYPAKRTDIWKEARVDIPPLYRSLTWAALLGVDGDVYSQYAAIDKDTVTQSDRQIEVDIPRCHQYNELLSSPTGHLRMKRVLKAWVVSNDHLVYWQGLDSLCAPFLFLNFDNEALAFACLSHFVPKYLNSFFLKDNSHVIQEYLAVFAHLIAFHEPKLSNHMEEIGFIPDLYAIPWFLTMFAHVFPLHKVLHLWDTLLLGNSSFPLCIGLSILLQLKDQLLDFGFNECILLFSEMPEIDIEKSVQDSIRTFCATPKSAIFLKNATPGRKLVRPLACYYDDVNASTEKAGDSLRSRSRLTRLRLLQDKQRMMDVPLEELKTERCPRISPSDMIELGEFNGTVYVGQTPTKMGKSKARLCILDIRSAEEFKQSSIPGSKSIPWNESVSNETLKGQLAKTDIPPLLVKVVVGTWTSGDPVKFAVKLVELEYSKVCVLHNGIESLHDSGILVSSSSGQ